MLPPTLPRSRAPSTACRRPRAYGRPCRRGGGFRPWKGKASTQSSGRPSRDRGHQRQRVALRGRIGVLAQVAYVFVVEVDVDEAAQLPLVVKDLLAQVGELGGQRGEHLAHGDRKSTRLN